jgi:hypothetical protein
MKFCPISGRKLKFKLKLKSKYLAKNCKFNILKWVNVKSIENQMLRRI